MLKPMTKEELELRRAVPEVYKKAIEHSIWESAFPEELEDKVWPDYFRADEVETLLGCELHEEDELDEDEFVTECMWFGAGWKAREQAKQPQLK